MLQIPLTRCVVQEDWEARPTQRPKSRCTTPKANVYETPQMAERTGVAASASLGGDLAVACTDSLMPSSHMASTLAGSSLNRRLMTVWVLFRSVRLCICTICESRLFLMRSYCLL